MPPLNEFELNAPGGMSTIDGGVASGSIGPMPTAQPAPTAAPVAGAPLATAPTDPRIGQLADAKTQLQTIQQSLDAGLDAPAGPAFGSFDTFTEQTPFDENAARKEAQRNQLRLHQAEIDATNTIYDEQLAQARLEGEGRLGSTRAIGARGGILGSDFSSSQKQEQIGANTAQQRAINAERSAKIGAIMGNVRNSVVAEMEDRRQAYTLGADALLANIAGQASRKQANVQQFAGDLIAQGFDITDLDEEELKAIATEAGVTTNDLISGFAQAKASVDTEGETTVLKQGETLVGADGVEIARGQDKPVIFKEGDVIQNADGTTTKIGKTSAPKQTGSGGEIFTSKDLPGDIRSDLLDDIQAGQSVEQLINLYPEVNLETIQDMSDQFFVAEEEPGIFSEFFSRFTQ